MTIETATPEVYPQRLSLRDRIGLAKIICRTNGYGMGWLGALEFFLSGELPTQEQLSALSNRLGEEILSKSRAGSLGLLYIPDPRGIRYVEVRALSSSDSSPPQVTAIYPGSAVVRDNRIYGNEYPGLREYVEMCVAAGERVTQEGRVFWQLPLSDGTFLYFEEIFKNAGDLLRWWLWVRGKLQAARSANFPYSSGFVQREEGGQYELLQGVLDLTKQHYYGPIKRLYEEHGLGFCYRGHPEITDHPNQDVAMIKADHAGISVVVADGVTVSKGMTPEAVRAETYEAASYILTESYLNYNYTDALPYASATRVDVLQKCDVVVRWHAGNTAAFVRIVGAEKLLWEAKKAILEKLIPIYQNTARELGYPITPEKAWAWVDATQPPGSDIVRITPHITGAFLGYIKMRSGQQKSEGQLYEEACREEACRLLNGDDDNIHLTGYTPLLYFNVSEILQRYNCRVSHVVVASDGVWKRFKGTEGALFEPSYVEPLATSVQWGDDDRTYVWIKVQ